MSSEEQKLQEPTTVVEEKKELSEEEKKRRKEEKKRAKEEKKKKMKELEKQRKKEKKAKKKEEKEKEKEKKEQGKTGLALTATKMGAFSKWYQEVITKSEMIDYYTISGCYVFRPWSFKMWEFIQKFIDTEIAKLGVKNCYFPMFVSQRALETEAEHVSGFAPEVAWVTKSGQSELAEPIAVRPTSETVMYPHFANWIRSHKDLPLKLNQWCNVVRWEFKHPIPFIRGREFLWQEGHTAHATREEAEKEVQDILDIYARVYEELMAIPVIKGQKSENEKFAGGFYTTTIESYVTAVGRSVQSATSHCLGQNFSKMFNIQYESENKTKEYVWQNSWGLSTRSLGALVMIHGDDKGLVLPPRIAPIQVVIVPIISKNNPQLILEKAKEIEKKLNALGIRVELDDRDNYTPGWKYNYWELRGVPVRLEIGARDVENKQVVLARRDSGKKEPVPEAELETKINELLDDIQKSLYNKAKKERDEKLSVVTTWEDFMKKLNAKHCCLVPWCNTRECEDRVKERSKQEESGEEGMLSGAAKSLCIPYSKEYQKELPEGTKCFACDLKATCWTLYGRSF